MKKFLIAIISVLIAFWVGTLAFISNPLTVTAVGAVKASAAKVTSFIQDTANWRRWWPDQQADPYQYRILSRTGISTRLLAQQGSDTFTSEIVILPATTDSSLVHWTTQQPASINPFTRIQQYRRATKIKQHLQLLLDSLTAYMQDRKKMYGMNIAITQFMNPYMLNTKTQFAHYPTIDEVYASVNKLRVYASSGKAAAVDSPMVNIQLIEGTYLLRTALPVDKRLSTTGNIDFKQMVLGNTLLGTVNGGQQQVEQSLLKMHEFIGDHQLTSPAIPFQVWQTNRQQQPDSTQWVTRLYYPIF